jgi:protein-S-isoprenylcysteine O-methyltransferase Ste14
MELFLIPLILGFVFAGAASFTAAYSRRFGERGGRAMTAVLRNVFGAPLMAIGYVWAWVTPSPSVFLPATFLTIVGWILVLAGATPFVIGHLNVGVRSHLPSARDTLVRHGLYAYVRHPIYAGSAIVMLGLVLIRPSLTVLVASSLAFVWFFVWARLEEIDLVQRIPEYRDYMRDVPRFIPRLQR